MGYISEFKKFAMQGNVIDLAIGIVIGAAFGKIVSSLIDDVITPLILTPALDAANLSNVTDLKWGAVKYGSFLSNIISFIIVAIVLFMIIKAMNSAKKKEVVEAAPAEPSSTDKLLMQIKESLDNIAAGKK